MFCVESQGPWNGACSLKHLKQGAFLGHPASYNWYEFAKKHGRAAASSRRRTRGCTSKRSG